MEKQKRILAFDLGAESGRAIIGVWQGQKLKLDIVHRFPHFGTNLNNHLHWDILHLFREMKRGLTLAAEKYAGHLDSLGCDTWGVDFGLLDKQGHLLQNPYCYRDSRTTGMIELAQRLVGKDRLYAKTGIQFMPFNTVFQILAMVREKSPVLRVAETLLLMPDLFHYFFTGVKVSEFSIVSTTQLYDPTKKNWSWEIIKDLKIPRQLFTKIVSPGTKIGMLKKSILNETNLTPVPVVTTAGHDTASAVAAVPVSQGEGNWAYLSSGTWSLLGVELRQPILNQKALENNFTNEGGVEKTIRFLKNIMGLWLVQQCRAVWERKGEKLDYTQITKLAQGAKAFQSYIYPDHLGFFNPPDMPAEICKFCQKTGQRIPATRGEIVRCALESLAFDYRYTLENIEKVTGRKIKVLHIVGGGSQNRLLNQFTANACGIPVVAGPVEATAIGNIGVQAMGIGYLRDVNELRKIIRQSFPISRYEPQQTAQWEEEYQKFLQVV